MPTTETYLIATAATITLLLLVGAFLYLTDTGQDVFQWFAEQYFKAEAKAAKEALQKTGSDKAQSFLKDQLKKNPLVDNAEVED